MVFKVGETVVYPHHGAALIEAIETRVIKGEEKKYLVLKVAQGDLTGRVPADNAEIVGVRDVVGQEGLDKVFDVLRAPHTEEPTNWSRRYKANLEKLASGDVNKVAEVVRDLWRREKDRGLSAGEKRMLAKARQILVSELALAEGTDESKAATLLDEVLETASVQIPGPHPGGKPPNPTEVAFRGSVEVMCVRADNVNAVKAVALLVADAHAVGVEVRGEVLLAHAIRVLVEAGCVDRIVTVVAAGMESITWAVPGEHSRVLPAAATRADSIRLAFEAAGSCDVFLVHDAARALAPPSTIRAVAEAVFQGSEAVAPVL